MVRLEVYFVALDRCLKVAVKCIDNLIVRHSVEFLNADSVALIPHPTVQHQERDQSVTGVGIYRIVQVISYDF